MHAEARTTTRKSFCNRLTGSRCSVRSTWQDEQAHMATDTQQKASALHLVNPKTPANVGGVLRAASIFGAEQLTWTGERVHDALHRYTGTVFGAKKMRLPREERMKAYDIDWGRDDD